MKDDCLQKNLRSVSYPLEPSDAEAMAAAKKARSADVQSFLDIQIEDLKLKDTGKKQKDSEDSLIVLPLESFNLTPSGWLSTKSAPT
jgi:hypothetical protein